MTITDKTKALTAIQTYGEGRTYTVSFRIGDFWHNNIVIADSEEDIKTAYSKYGEAIITAVENPNTVRRDIMLKGKPVSIV